MTPKPGRPRTVAFYLPQFHPIPENDEWWGEGFTEWTNVRRATPTFFAHDQPAVAGDLGEYDLRDAQIMHKQAALAAANDIDAFCFYFYWFSGKRLLETPVDNFLTDGPDFPFCLSWANENWSRRWDGKDAEVLIGQNYDEGFVDDSFLALLPYLLDGRYLRTHAGAAVLMVHRIDHIPDAKQMASRWRDLAREHGAGELHLVAAETKPGIRPESYGVDAVAEFPPVGSNVLSVAQLRPLNGLDKEFRGRLMSYPRLARRFSRRREPRFVRYRGVAPGWDNSPRRRSRATIYVGSTPELYRRWLKDARTHEMGARGQDGLVFVNAWNEWAEGAYLEPDGRHGDAYLRATNYDAPPDSSQSKTPRAGRPTWGWLRSIASTAAGSVLGVSRTAANIARSRLR
ncbi:glycoside hydrolase family 99-like domain-containing protein [Microbacterium sp. CJ77]|uniref:glycosyltransferase WbsX family protein n=1 Tax=Microbacterium sp. CJ77 TaxID=2079201 RepID=UPI000CD97EFE|nr:glycoside hydrolase family 99-like domain-containing protein [Microbacterium sp. CJ77]